MTATIHDLIARQARQRPAEIALLDRDGALSYAELERQATALAADLALTAETRVGIWMPRRRSAVVAMLAVLKAGGAYVPLDPAYPADRIAFMTADSECGLVLTDGGRCPPLPATVRTLDIAGRDQGPHRSPPGAGAAPPGPASPDQLAVILYTSGSTGRPKGTMLTHANVAALAHGHPALRHAPGEIVAHVLSSSFDAVLLDVWGALIHGASVFLCTSDALRSVGHLAEELDQLPITTLPLTSSLFHQLAEVRPDRIARSARVWFGGEPADPSVVGRLCGPGTRLVHHYGPTECTSIATVHVVGPVVTAAPAIPIGRPLDSVQLHVLASDLVPVPPGQTGELFIGGPQVTRGYLGQPRLTAARFIPDPYGCVAGARLFRTGDLVLELPGGDLQFVGRGDDQVKIRGYRVEPAEVSAVLRAVPGVSDAVTLARDDLGGERRLVAYVAGTADADAVRDAASRALPEYLRPSDYMFLDALPLLPNHKVDRGALPAPPRHAAALHDTPRPGPLPHDTPPPGPPPAGPVPGTTPVSEVQSRLAQLWCEVLDVSAVQPDDDFFALGGYSLLAARLVSRIQATFGAQVRLRALFEARTLRQLAVVVAAGARPAPAASPPVQAPQASAEQSELWFLDRLDPGRPDYNSPIAFRVRGALDLTALRRAVEEIIRRHEVLRWFFRPAGGELRVVVGDPFDVPFVAEHCRSMAAGVGGGVDRDGDGDGADANAVDQALATWLDERRQQPFDLGAGPLLRLNALRLAEDDVAVLVTVHHIVFDGWSFAVLVTELGRLYDAYCDGLPSPLPDLPAQYGEVVAADRQHLDSGALAGQLAYWRDALDGAPPVIDLPAGPTGASRTGASRTGAAAGHAVCATGSITGALAGDIRQLARQSGGTPFMAMLSALGLALHALSGAADMVVACPSLRRVGPHADELIGMFVRMLPMRIRVSAEQSLAGWHQAVQQTVVGALENRDVPFGRIIAELRPPRSSRVRAPYSQVVFNMVNLRMVAPRLRGLNVELLRVQTAEPRVPLAVIVTEDEDRYDLTVLADPRRIAPECAEAVVLLLPAAAQLVAGRGELLVAEAVRSLPMTGQGAAPATGAGSGPGNREAK